MKLIDKDALVVEIKRRQSEHNEKKYGYASSDHFWASVEDEKILSFIDTLEVKEVDFEKEPDPMIIYDYSRTHIPII